MNRLIKRTEDSKPILAAYITAGFPNLDSTIPICKAFEANGADVIEIGFPFSDPLADGEIIQKANLCAIQNGMTLKVLFSQLEKLRSEVSIPVILMGYFNPVVQYGISNFFKKLSEIGIDGAIIPDLPIYEFKRDVQSILKETGLVMPLLITPTTNDLRIKEIDSISSGFIYAVSSNSTTGGVLELSESRITYLKHLRSLELKNKIFVGFGISNRETVQEVQSYCKGAIVASAIMKAIQAPGDPIENAAKFVRTLASNN